MSTPNESPKRSVQETVKSIIERLQGTANVKTVYGEPVEAKGKVIIPVAKVAYGFGAGSGFGKKIGAEDQQGGAGAGGGVAVRPAGVIEITPEGTRFVPIASRGKILAILLLGFGLGVVMAGTCCRRNRRNRSD
jgi:uncharacterized spore protein YtfJ